MSHDRIGEVLVAQGDGPGALAAYRRGLSITEALAARDPANTQWQRDLSVSHGRIGNVLVAQGDEPGAVAAYRRGLSIQEALAARDRCLANTRIAVRITSKPPRGPNELSALRRRLRLDCTPLRLKAARDQVRAAD